MPIAREPEGVRHPMRTCIGCRVSAAQDDLLRLHLVANDGGGHRVEPTIGWRARTGPAGRGAYVCPRRSCLDQAIKRRAFPRAFSSRSAGSTAMSTPMLIESPTADALWTTAIAQVRCEIELLDRSSQPRQPHAQPRRRGLERLLSELSSAPIPPVRPTPIDRRPRSNGQGGTPAHG